MAVRRRFTQEFKLAVVREYLAEGVRRAALARQYDVAPGQIQAWQKRYKPQLFDEFVRFARRDELIQNDTISRTVMQPSQGLMHVEAH